MTVVPALADAQLRPSDLVERQEVVMVKAGQPVARLVPVRRRVRTLQAGFNDPASVQVQWGSAA